MDVINTAQVVQAFYSRPAEPFFCSAVKKEEKK